MKTLIYIVLIIGLMVSSTTKDTKTTKNTEILIVDLSKKLPSNPYQEEYERMLYPTVRIKAGNSIGSGVAFTTENTESTEAVVYILTAAHVVGDESTVTIELFYPDNIEIEATVIITDTTKDLALLTTDRRHRLTQVYSAKLAPKEYKPYIFAPIYTIGCSLGLLPRPSQGIISVIEDTYWEVTSPILPGNSGGPVFDARTYEVIGIAVWIQTYQGQLITTMAGVVPIQAIYEFMKPQIDTDKH